jgi:phosphopantothenoylcysteine decarboxylase/phosphopantothenate--cysteine ligase
MDFVHVVSAQEMHDEVMRKVAEYDIFLAVAAVGDYRCQTVAAQKIHKKDAAMQLLLERNPDIAASVGKLSPKPFIVGFAAETEDVVSQAKDKRKRKNMDMIVANRVGGGAGMGSDDNEVTVIGADEAVQLPAAPKRKLARQLITMIANEFKRVKHVNKTNGK